MAELKPCPFCGADVEDIQVRDYFLPWQDGVGMHIINMIYCRKCGGALIDQNRNHCHNDRVAAWNRRAGNGRM